MSLGTGKALGLTASLITVIVPIIMAVLDVLLIISVLGSISFALTGGTPSFAGLAFASGILISVTVLGFVIFVGSILFLVAMHSLSEYYEEPDIFRNALWGFLTNIIGGVVLILILIAVGLSGLGENALSDLVAIILVVFVFLVVSGVLYRRSFNSLGDKSGVYSFKTAGTLYLIGAALTIVLVGGLIVWIGWIFAMLGFSSLKPRTVGPSTISYPTPQPPAAASPEQKKFCVYCGAEISLDSVYCPNCGKQVQ